MSLTVIKTEGFTVRGRSLGGFYTGLHVPELRALFDVGTALRTGAACPNLFLSHAHADHLGSLPALIGMRGLTGIKEPIKVFLPEDLASELPTALQSFGALHHWPLQVEIIPMKPGDMHDLGGHRWVRAIRTLHPVPSLGFVFFRRVQKLKPEFLELPGEEIRDRRIRGDDLFIQHDYLDFAYVTDTLPEVLDQNPELYNVSTLVLECTFLDERKSIENARAGCHIHLDELLPHIPKFQNESVVLMHFSQLYSPEEVHEVFDARCPPEYRDRFRLFAPKSGPWWD